ncbi:MAG: hypothetical protein JSV44_06220 [Candidatus Zixiibacteriota bacterium]|nr:MAG: hypothetical protein JSV44_06220 [candidate division Zixibacteria bacterium]
MFLGFTLLLAGILLLLTRSHILPGDFWDYGLPILLVALGAKIIFSQKKRL